MDPLEPERDKELIHFSGPAPTVPSLSKPDIEKQLTYLNLIGGIEEAQKALSIASERGQMEYVEILTSLPISIDTMREGKTPLHYAALKGHCQAAKCLLESKASVSTQVKGDHIFNETFKIKSATPLHLSVLSGSKEIAKLLLQFKAPIEAFTPSLGTPLTIAFAVNNIETAKLLLTHKAMYRVCELMIAVEKKRLEAAKLLIEVRAPINQFNKSGDTPLAKAISNKHASMVKLLLNNKVDLNPKEYEKNTYLHQAAEQGDEEVMAALLNASKDCSPKDPNGSTPLHLAAAKGHEAVVKLLLEHNADAGALNDRYRSAADCANLEKHKNVAKILEQASGKRK